MTVAFTTDLSIIVQLITGLVSIRGIFLNVEEKHKVLTDILKVESAVQIIELFFYIYFLRTLASSVSGMAATRYFDWIITTPTMLLTTILYFKYEQELEKDNNNIVSFWDFIETNKKNILFIFVCNFLMLAFGYLGEIHVIDTHTSILIGFIFFILSFHTIWKDYAVHSQTGKNMYIFLVSIWALYGVAAALPDIPKNNTYNILDLFAKNFFGVFLYYKASQLSKK
jgi:bacteriorhodopsin